MQFITYKDEKLPLKLSFGAMKKYNSNTGKNILKLDENLTLEDIEQLFIVCYQSGCKAEGVVEKYTASDAETILDECYKEFVSVIPILVKGDVKKK